MVMTDQVWTVAEAKAHFSEVLHRAETAGPQVITRRGDQVAVIVAAGEWHRKTRRTSTLAEFLAGSPLAGSQLEVTRERDEPREVAL